MLTGGGTGGHITPLLAVAEQLKQLEPDCHITYVGERGGKFTELTQSALFDNVYQISAGKFRRYHNTSWLEKMFDIRTILLNIRDGFRVVRGTVQSWFLLRRLRPDVVFLKGGYVGLPVGVSAGLRSIPMVTHDSDTIPGLANRVAGRWAQRHAVAAAADSYPYPAEHTARVGVLVEAAYTEVTAEIQKQYRADLGLPLTGPIVLVTGGSSGAVRINTAIVGLADKLLSVHPDLVIIHQTGKGKADVYGDYQHDRLRVMEFLRPMASYMGAADIVVCRGSANTIAELAVQGKAVIVIPSPYLANGHQLKNAEALEEQGSAVVVQEKDIDRSGNGLLTALDGLLSNEHHRRELAQRLHETAPVGAARNVAKLILEVARS